MDNKKIKEMMDKGYNCSQVVFSYFAEDYGIDKNTAMKIATPFEMGIYESKTCGALSASYMVLALKYGSTDMKERLELAEKIKELNNIFKEKMGAIECKDLLGMKILEGNNIEIAEEKGLFQNVCANSIKTAITALEDLL